MAGSLVMSIAGKITSTSALSLSVTSKPMVLRVVVRNGVIARQSLPAPGLRNTRSGISKSLPTTRSFQPSPVFQNQR